MSQHKVPETFEEIHLGVRILLENCGSAGISEAKVEEFSGRHDECWTRLQAVQDCEKGRRGQVGGGLPGVQGAAGVEEVGAALISKSEGPPRLNTPAGLLVLTSWTSAEPGP